MASVGQLGYLGLSVKDMAAWETFATEVLGLEVSERADDGMMYLRMDEYHHRFLVHPDGKDDLAYIGWEVPKEEEFWAMKDQLEAAGVEVAQGTQAEIRLRRVARLLKFHDPSGIASEIYYGPAVEYANPYKSPRPISGFLTDEHGLGHIVIVADDFDESLHFYRDVLGMRLTDFVQRDNPSGSRFLMAFFHCNPRHHSIAFMAGQQPARRLSHIMIQAKTLDDVGTTYDLAQERGVPLATTLGRHMNDHMVSFYMRSPSGFNIEYGWGARTVDDGTWRVMVHTSGDIWGHQRVER